MRSCQPCNARYEDAITGLPVVVDLRATFQICEIPPTPKTIPTERDTPSSFLGFFTPVSLLQCSSPHLSADCRYVVCVLFQIFFL